jgi:Tfp pilus assembly protein PilO
MRDWPWYGYILVAVIIFGLFFLFYYKPKNEEFDNIKAEREQTEQEVVHLKQKQKEITEIEKELENMGTQLRELETIIPAREEIDVILRKIQQLAFDSRINIVNFVPKALITKEFYAEKPITIEMTGSYHNLATFFSRLSNFSRLFNIENFNIKALRNQSEGSTITATATAKTYIFVEPEPEPVNSKAKKKPARK